MAALPATLVLFLYVTLASGYTILRDDDDNEIVWPTEYHFTGEKLNFKSSLKENFEMWYNGDLNRSRIDFNDGALKKFYYEDTGYAYVKYPITTEEVTNKEICIGRTLKEDQQIDFLPDVSEFTYTGQNMRLYDKDVGVWTHTKKYEETMSREKTLYVFKTDSGIDLPVQLVSKTYNLDLGELTSHIIINFFGFRDTVSEEEVSVDEEDECERMRLGKDFHQDIKFFHPDLPSEMDLAFNLYTNHHNKFYQDEEHEMRKSIFEKNWRMVEEYNRKNLGFKVKLNEFSDKTDEELNYLTGTFISTNKNPDMIPFPHNLTEVHSYGQALPENFDLRMQGVITPVKHQGQCGSCWAFSTTAAVEGAIAKATGWLLDLSEQSLVDCAWGFGNLGCGGGYIDGALNYVYYYGVPTEETYGPYEADVGYCKVNQRYPPYGISGYSAVPRGDANALKVALHNYGPVAVGVHCSWLMQHYSSGVLYDSLCDEPGAYANHAVVVVGYGVRGGEAYWIIKNSWGEYWGEDGYILMSARNNNCFVLDTAYFPFI